MEMEELLPVYVDLVNKSLSEGTMDGIKHSEIDPLLEKHGLDSDIKKNFLGVADEILTGFDNDECTVMLFIDLSAAFDTIDINRMVEILRDEIGLEGEALSWCRSFLSNRTQRVKINGHYSDKLVIKYGLQ